MTTEERHYIQQLFRESIPAIAKAVAEELKSNVIKNNDYQSRRAEALAQLRRSK